MLDKVTSGFFFVLIKQHEFNLQRLLFQIIPIFGTKAATFLGLTEKPGFFQKMSIFLTNIHAQTEFFATVRKSSSIFVREHSSIKSLAIVN